MIQAGDRIAGKYRIVKTLGSGGMGVVYLAQHERLERQVAIKVLSPQPEEPSGAIARFEREIRAMSMVRSPHVAHALDADVLDDGSLYLVMEYLEGRDLREERNLRRTIPIPEAVAYVMQACEGVAAVHELGIIHRDLKPHNLFVTQLDAARCVKVLDFGIAKFLGAADVTITGRDVAMGTPLYMSPEQLSSPDAVTSLTDVWSLGVVLYELIAGISPFAADTPGAVVAAIVLDDPIWLNEVANDVPQPLAEIVADALTKPVAKRIGSAREFAQRLAPFGMPLDSIFVSASAPSEQKVAVLRRPSMSPDLAERIKSEVAGFDSTTPNLRRGANLDDLRRLPSLAKLAVPQTIPASPAAQAAALHPGDLKRPDMVPVIISVAPETNLLLRLPPNAAGSTHVSLPHVTAEPRAQEPRRWQSRKLGVLLTFLGLVCATVYWARESVPSRRASTEVLRLGQPNPTTTAALTDSAHGAAASVATSLTGPVVQDVASHVASATPSVVVQAKPQRVAPVKRKPVRIPAERPILPSIPVATDGKPLHL